MRETEDSVKTGTAIGEAPAVWRTPCLCSFCKSQYYPLLLQRKRPRMFSACLPSAFHVYCLHGFSMSLLTLGLQTKGEMAAYELFKLSRSDCPPSWRTVVLSGRHEVLLAPGALMHCLPAWIQRSREKMTFSLGDTCDPSLLQFLLQTSDLEEKKTA